MAVNKVIFGQNTLIDISSDTVSADNLLTGTTAHDKSGNQITGAVSFVTVYEGAAEPSSSVGNDGDIYLKVVN